MKTKTLKTNKETPSFSKVLLIDDDNINNLVFSKLGKRAKLYDEITIISNPIEAVDYIKNLDSNNHPDVIFLDINMPVISGWKLLEEVKEYINPKQTRVFIASSSKHKADIEKAQNELLVTDLIEKPINVKKMIELKGLYLETSSYSLQKTA